MKILKSFLFIFFPLFGLSQSLNGVYTGVLSNDSTTIRKDQSFEMALTEYNGKVYGYAYSTFIVNDTLYYIVKRVKGKVEGDICEVEDDEVITHNFPQKPEKKVFVTYTLRRDATDSLWRLDGNWKTNLTKKYYAISGKVETKEEKDLSKSKLFEHLGDLDLQKTLVLTRPKEKEPDTKTVKKKDNKTDIAKNTVKKDKKNTDAKTGDKKPDESIAKADINVPANTTISNTINTQPQTNEKKDAIVNNNTTVEKKTEPVVAKTEPKNTDNKSNSTSSNPLIQNEKKDVPVSNSTVVDKKPENDIAKADTGVPGNKTVPATTNNSQVQNVNKDIAANNTSDKKTDAPIVKTENKAPDNKAVSNPVINNQPNQTAKQDAIANTNVVDKKTETNIAKPDNKLTDNKTSNVAINNQPKQEEKKNVTVAVTNPNNNKPETLVAKTEEKAPEKKLVSVPVGNQPVANEKKDVAIANNKPANKKPDNDFEFQELKRTSRTLKPAAKLVDGRLTNPSETIYFSSDSISIALYDNGEVDGDTVSVIINDEMFIEKQGLKSSAFRKTFYIPQGQGDSLLVVLYAENLGKYPPNTGLLQIKDGDEISYVRFKADLDRNAAIVLRRKSK